MTIITVTSKLQQAIQNTTDDVLFLLTAGVVNSMDMVSDSNQQVSSIRAEVETQWFSIQFYWPEKKMEIKGNSNKKLKGNQI